MKISVLILTKDEELTIKDCIESMMNISDDIHIVDSFSADDTMNIVNSLGVNYLQNVFVNYAQQRNYALSTCDFQSEWVFMVDADERLSEELVHEILELSEEKLTNIVCCYLTRHDFFLGKRLRFSQVTNVYPRIFKAREVFYEREVHEKLVFNGETLKLSATLLHYPFMNGGDRWLSRHQDYAAKEAAMLASDKSERSFIGLIKKSVINLDKACLKAAYYKLPFFPVIKFIYMFIVRLGILDGRAGFLYCLMIFHYELSIYVKYKLLKEDKSSS